jgi:hypothetical protein
MIIKIFDVNSRGRPRITWQGNFEDLFEQKDVVLTPKDGPKGQDHIPGIKGYFGPSWNDDQNCYEYFSEKYAIINNLFPGTFSLEKKLLIMLYAKEMHLPVPELENERLWPLLMSLYESTTTKKLVKKLKLVSQSQRKLEIFLRVEYQRLVFGKTVETAVRDAIPLFGNIDSHRILELYKEFRKSDLAKVILKDVSNDLTRGKVQLENYAMYLDVDASKLK